MRKILSVLFAVGIASAAFAVDSLVIKNTANTDVFKVSYESGVSTVTVSGVVAPTTLSAATATAGTLTVQTQAVFTASSSTTVTALQAVATSGTIMPITAATAVTNVTLAAVAAGKVGQVVTLVNVGTNAITVLDTAPAYLSADLALGQRDTLSLYIYATNELIQTSTANN